MKLKIIASIVIVSILSSCASDGYIAKQFGYDEKNYIPKDKINEYIAKQPIEKQETIVKYDELTTSRNAVLSSRGLTNNKQVVSAFNNFVNGKNNYIVKGKNSKVYPYDPYNEETIICSFGYICTITLEKGELMTGTSKVGVSSLWDITSAITGQDENKTQIISLKALPLISKGNDDGISLDKQSGASTNFIVPTNKRVYNFRLIVNNGSSYENISFYYPNETLNMMNKKLKARYENKIKEEESKVSLLDDPTIIKSVDKNGDIILNTRYEMSIRDDNLWFWQSEKKPSWNPITVFDNGAKTVIQFPKNIHQVDLPNVMVIKDTKDQEILNPRYRNNKYILDGVYKKILLFKTGSDNKTKVQITITNEDYPK